MTAPPHAHRPAARTQPPDPVHPPGLTALLLIVAAVMCLGVVFAGLLTARLLDLRDELALAKQDCNCCDPAQAPRWQ